MVPLTTPCVVGRNEYAPRFEVIEPPGHPSELVIKSSPLSRSGGSSRSRFANTIQPPRQSPVRDSQFLPSLERQTLTICPRLIASDRARNSECRKPLTTLARCLLRWNVWKLAIATVARTATMVTVVCNSTSVVPAVLTIRLPAARVAFTPPYAAPGPPQSRFFTSFAWILASARGPRYAQASHRSRGQS